MWQAEGGAWRLVQTTGEQIDAALTALHEIPELVYDLDAGTYIKGALPHVRDIIQWSTYLRRILTDEAIHLKKPSYREISRLADVAPSTLTRWAKTPRVVLPDGSWSITVTAPEDQQ